MKEIKYCIIAFLLIICFFSCSIESETSSEFTLYLPSAEELFDEPQHALSVGYYARVFLLSKEKLQKLGVNNFYLEKKIQMSQSEPMVIENISTGKYKLLVSIGKKNSNNNDLVVSGYAESNVFEVLPGSVTKVKLTYTVTPFTVETSLVGRNIKGVKTIATNVYASGRFLSYTGTYTGTTLDLTGSLYPFANFTVNSMGRGYNYTGFGAPGNCMFINSNRGIIKWNLGVGFDTSFTAALGQISIIESYSYADGNNVAIYFKSKNGLGGCYQDGTDAWLNIDLTNILAGTPVYSIAISQAHISGYFATKFGAFRFPQDILSGYNGGSTPDYMSSVIFFNIIKNGNVLPILSLSTTGDIIYIGTTDGVYKADLNGTTGNVENPVLIPETRGSRITKIEINPGPPIRVAFASDYYLYVYNNNTKNVLSYPFCSGVPGSVNAMNWNQASGDLFIAGSKGISVLPF